MVGGFNTNIRYGGRTFHIQTEDSGEANPQVSTLLYEGGAILYSKKRRYEEELLAEGLESEVRALMEEQHRRVVQALKSGLLDQAVGLDGPAARGDAAGAGSGPEPVGTFGEGIITDTPLAEVVLRHLSAP